MHDGAKLAPREVVEAPDDAKCKEGIGGMVRVVYVAEDISTLAYRDNKEAGCDEPSGGQQEQLGLRVAVGEPGVPYGRSCPNQKYSEPSQKQESSASRHPPFS